MAGRVAPVPPFVELPSLPRPQVVDEAGFELSDEQIEALAARLAGDGAPDEEEAQEGQDREDEEDEEDEENEEVEESAQVSVAEGEAPEERQPLLSLDQSLVLQYSILQTRHHHMRHLLPLIFTHPPVPAHNRPRLRPSGKKEFIFPTPAPPPQPLPSAEYHGPSTKEKKKKKGKEKEKETDQNTGAAGKDKEEEKSGDESDTPKKGRKKEQQAPAHEIECIARVTLQIGPMSFPNTELWVARFVPPRQGSAGTVRGRLKSMAEPRKPKDPKPKESKEKVRKERALPRMSIDGGAAKRPRTEKPPKAPKPTAAPATQASAPPPPADVPPRFASRQDIPQALIQRVNAAATRHPWLSVLIHKAARSVASKDELAKLGRVVARLGRGEDVGEGPEMPGVPVRPPVRPPSAAAGPSRPPPGAPVRPPVVGVRPPNTVAGPAARPGLPAARPPAPVVRPPTTGAPVRPPAAVRPPAHATAVRPSAPAAAAARPPPATPPATASAPAAPQPPPVVPAETPVASIPAPAPPAPAEDMRDESDSDVDMSGRPQVGGGWRDESDAHSDWDADIEMKGRSQVGGGGGEEPEDETADGKAPVSKPGESSVATPATPAAAPASQSMQTTPAPASATTPQQSATRTIAHAATAAPAAPTTATPVPAVQPPATTTPAALGIAPPATSNVMAPPAPATVHPPPSAPARASPTVTPASAPTPSGSNVRWFPIAGSPNPGTPGAQRGPIRPPGPRPSNAIMVPPYQIEGPQPPPFLLVAFKGQETDKFLLPLGQHSYLSRVGGDYVTSPAPTPAPTTALPAAPAAVTAASNAVPTPAPAPALGPVTPTSEPPVEPEQPPVHEPPRGRKRTRASMAKPAPKPPLKSPPKPQVEKKEKEKEPAPAPVDPLANTPPMPGQPSPPGTVLLSTFVPIEPYTKPDWAHLADRLPFNNPSFVEKMKAAPVEVKPELQSPKRALRRVKEDKRPRDYVLNVAAEEWLPDGPIEPVTIRLVGVDDRTWARVKGVVEQVETTELDALVRAEPGLAPEMVKAKARAETEAAKAAAPAPAPAPTPVPPNPAPGVPTVKPALADGAAPTPAPPAVAPAPPSAGTPATPVQATPVGQPTPPLPAPTAAPIAIPPLPMIVRETWLARKKSLFAALLLRVGTRCFPRFRLETTISTLVDFTADKWAPRSYHLTTRPLYARDVDSDDEVPAPAPRRLELSPSPDLEGHSKKRRKEVSAVTFEMPVSLDALDERVEAGAARGLSKRGRAKGAAVVRKFPRGTAGAVCEGCARRGVKVWRRGPNGRGTLCNDCGDKFSAGTLGELKAPGAASRRDSTGTPAPAEEVKVERAESAVVEESEREPQKEGEKQKDGGEGREAGEAGEKDTAPDKAAQPEKATCNEADVADGAEASKETADDAADVPGAEEKTPGAPDQSDAATTAASSPDPLATTIEDTPPVGQPSTEASAPVAEAMDVDP